MSYIANADWSTCTECGECLMRCPVLKMKQEDAVAAIRKLIRGKATPEVLDRCTFCFNCNRYCPVEGLRPHELILQRALEKRKKVPGILKYLSNGRGTKNMFGDLYIKLTSNEKQILKKWTNPPTGGEVLWVGCEKGHGVVADDEVFQQSSGGRLKYLCALNDLPDRIS